MDNSIKLENNPYHQLICKERKNLELSGVKNIERFDESEFVLETSKGWMTIHGQEMTLVKFDTEQNEVMIKGQIDCIEYDTSHKSQQGSFFTRLFK